MNKANLNNFFNKDLQSSDVDLYNSISQEFNRQTNHIELIASENMVSRAVLEAQGSVLTNKYAEGYSGKRYYGGCEFVDIAENLAIDRATKLFNCKFANVQPHSGAQANGAVYLALIKPGDTILGMSLNSGGHLTHGAKPAQSGKWFNAVHYDVNPETGLIDYENVEKLALENNPKILIAGGSAYSRIINFKKFREIADKVKAYLLVDMAHFSGLVAGGAYPNPLEYADVVTSTTHKVLRGPRGGIILTNNEELIKKFNSAIFPGLQGGPLMHVVAAKAVCFKEALDPNFRTYAKQVVENAKTLSETLVKNNFKIFSGGTDTHLMLLDLREFKLTGKLAESSLGKANITCNKNSIPFDTQSPMITSGVRLGTPASTTRGFTQKEFVLVGQLISKLLKELAKNPEDNSKAENEVKKEVIDLCGSFPIYSRQ
jgi:glycine hydroxymethyltransferase|tara:strand:+ start:509 stop:1798 length:1290 start_codon:yes stop_codon:yes gene_type:complete